jgi:hypothetical protein
MAWEKPLDGRCINKLENGEKCGQEIKDQGARLYCKACRKAGKRKRDRKRSADRRKYDREGDNFYHWQHYHGWTETQLRDFFDSVEALQEDVPPPNYEDYKHDLKEFHEVEALILNPDPHVDLPSAAKIANKRVKKLLKSLEDQKKASPKDSTIDLLILSTLGLRRDIGQRLSTMTFTNIGRKAKAVHELGKKLGESLILGYGLLVDVELARILYFAHYDSPRKRQFYANKARNTLSGAELFSDMTIERSTGRRKQVAEFLRFYVDSARLRQASDAGEGKASASHIEEADKRAMNFAAAYGEVPIVAVVQFLNLTNQAEYQLGRRNFDQAYHRLKEAKEKFAAMPWHSIEVQHRIASLETRWALESDDPEGERYVHTYRSVLKRNPCFEYRHCLRALKHRFKKHVPDGNLLTRDDKYLFVDTMHTLIQPLMIPILEGVEER